MALNTSLTSVILTYKGKVLLVGADMINLNKLNNNIWRFICGEKTGRESFDQAICRLIKYATRLDVKNIQRLKTHSEDNSKPLYHLELTDKEVNSIERREGQKLEFYSLNELRKLSLTDAAMMSLEEYRSVFEDEFIHEPTPQM
jgi:hypothetical protein